jgi:hypothetical protein
MQEFDTLDRRSLVALLAGATITIVACGSDSDSGNPASSTRTDDVMGEITNNHQHLARLGGPQIATGQEVTISIRGSATHDHVVAFTADEVLRLRGGERVTKGSSTTEGHQHAVIFDPAR